MEPTETDSDNRIITKEQAWNAPFHKVKFFQMKILRKIQLCEHEKYTDW